MSLDPADLGLLGDMLVYSKRAIRHLGTLDARAFSADEKSQDSVVRCLAIVGEAAWKMSDQVKSANPAVPWPLIAGMRHRLVHDYGAVDLNTVHRVVMEHLPLLIGQVETILGTRAREL